MRQLARPALLLAFCAAGCSGGDPIDGTGDGCKTSFLPGDLVIDEVFVDPGGDDAGKEWFEIYNHGEAADLEGLTLVSSKNDKTMEKTHVMTAMTLGAGQYLVLGGMTQDLKPAHVDYGFGNDLGQLRNTDGRLALRCGSTIIDEITYSGVTSDTSWGFTGADGTPPDAAANNDESKWCNAVAPYDGTAKGTPGGANNTCGGTSNPDTCMDGTAMRALVKPEEGDVVITEWMANPKAAADATGEWIELTVTRDVDLNGLTLGTEPPTVRTTLGGTACIRKTAGSRVLLARSDMAAMNGMLPAVDFTFDFGLTNSNGSIFVGIGTTVLDTVTFATSGDGVSTAVDPAHVSETENDVAANLCDGKTAFGGGDKGTPGGANPSCGGVDPGGPQCSDGGTMRDIVKPEAGDLVISEWMPDPNLATDANGEWFEVSVLHDVDLNGLVLGATPPSVGTTLGGAACIHVTAGTRLVFARTDVAANNGMLPRVDFKFTFGLTNTTNGSLFIGNSGTDVLDQVIWTTSKPGVSTAVDPDSLTPAGNDDTTNRCDGTATWAAGSDKGSPGEANASCP